jgi:LPXTG-site transpeptidase (sortase) family protein
VHGLSRAGAASPAEPPPPRAPLPGASPGADGSAPLRLVAALRGGTPGGPPWPVAPFPAPLRGGTPGGDGDGPSWLRAAPRGASPAGNDGGPLRLRGGGGAQGGGEWRWGVVAVLAAVLLAGCNGNGTVGGGGTAPTPTTGVPHSARTPTAAKATAMARSVPQRLRIPGIGVDTAVMALGLSADGTVGVPPIKAHAPAGWYDGSPTPGETGPSVLLGHVTVGAYGDGVFRHLDRMRPGDRVSVTRADGSTATFAVDTVQTVAKSHFPTEAVYGNVDHPALRLITCGGTRISDGGGYPDNVIVYASLAGGS